MEAQCSLYDKIPQNFHNTGFFIDTSQIEKQVLCISLKSTCMYMLCSEIFDCIFRLQDCKHL